MTRSVDAEICRQPPSPAVLLWHSTTDSLDDLLFVRSMDPPLPEAVLLRKMEERSSSVPLETRREPASVVATLSSKEQLSIVRLPSKEAMAAPFSALFDVKLQLDTERLIVKFDRMAAAENTAEFSWKELSTTVADWTRSSTREDSVEVRISAPLISRLPSTTRRTESSFDFAIRSSTEDEEPGGDDISENDVFSSGSLVFLRSLSPLRSFSSASLAKH